MKRDEINISITGTKKFRQLIVDLVYKALMDEKIEVETVGNQQNGFSMNSSLPPSEE